MGAIDEYVAEIISLSFGKALRNPLYGAITALIDGPGVLRPTVLLSQDAYNALEDVDEGTFYAIKRASSPSPETYDETKITCTKINPVTYAPTHIVLYFDSITEARDHLVDTENLYQVHIGSEMGIERIPAASFYNCKGIWLISIPEGVVTIGEGAFSNCENLTVPVLPESLLELSVGAFSSCTALDVVIFPQGLTSISSEAFLGCSSLTGIDVPGNVEQIDSKAFYGCSSLRHVVLSDGLRSIGEQAFQNCTSLTQVTIPSTVSTIDVDAFATSSLTSIRILKEPDSVSGAPWGALNATISWG